jgi:hypothetical protein
VPAGNSTCFKIRIKLDRRIQIFDDNQIRTFWDSEQEKWLVSITDVIAVLTESIDLNAYWNNLKAKLKKEGSELSAKSDS